MAVTIISSLYERKWTSKYRLEISTYALHQEQRKASKNDDNNNHHRKKTTHNQTPYICSKVKVKIGKRVRNRIPWSEDTNKGQHTYLCNIKCKFKDVNILHKRMHTACRHFVSVHEYTEYCERCVGLCWCIARIFRVFFLYWFEMVVSILGFLHS